jgi:hypothetical protein
VALTAAPMLVEVALPRRLGDYRRWRPRLLLPRAFVVFLLLNDDYSAPKIDLGKYPFDPLRSGLLEELWFCVRV